MLASGDGGRPRRVSRREFRGRGEAAVSVRDGARERLSGVRASCGYHVRRGALWGVISASFVAGEGPILFGRAIARCLCVALRNNGV
jgi:hypothetical protein